MITSRRSVPSETFVRCGMDGREGMFPAGEHIEQTLGTHSATKLDCERQINYWRESELAVIGRERGCHCTGRLE